MSKIKYSADGKTLIKCPEDYQGTFQIPDSVTTIEIWAFDGCTGLTSIEIPDSVTTIGNYAFSGCTALTSIEIPDSVTTIGYYAFSGCTGLTSIKIPNSVTTIGESAFKGCTQLPIDKDGCFYAGNLLVECRNKDLTSYVVKQGTRWIADFAFSGCTALTAIEIPDSVTTIGYHAFKGCTGLTSIEIPNSVTEIGYEAFEGCTQLPIDKDGCCYADNLLVECRNKDLTSYVVKQGTRWIADSAFKGCTALTSIEIPNSVTTIGNYAFVNIGQQLTIHVAPDNPAYCDIEGTLFTKHRQSILHLHLTKGQTEYTIPNSVTTIGNWAFDGCTGLTSIEIPNSVTTIGVRAFNGCTGLTAIEIPDSVTEIGQWAFNGCTCLTSIEIPNSVTTIGESAFDGCKSLTSIEIPNRVTKLTSNVFINIGQQLAIYVAPDNPAYCDIEGTLFTKDRSSILHFHRTEGQTEYTLPDSVQQIESWAFEWVNLNKLIVPEGVTEICKDAFWFAQIADITLPRTISYIGETAFKSNQLRTLHIRQEDPYQIEVADNAFEDTASHCTLYVPIGTGYAYRHHPVFGKFKEVVIEK